MAIDLTGLSSTPSANTRSKLDGPGQSTTGKNQQDVAERNGPAGSVTLSTEAQSLQKLEEQVGQLPDVNSERVAAIKAAIEDGSYSVDAEKLAASIINFEDQTFG
ncbi:MAG: flagellar biosynthesis anti-sigma factor FlgM [Motiliproteus sp.]|nr:flagellar biosynthesis anti-sigma factor FlgM [Motiliproteus sp.]MCW9051978.1 flagellar biosynthesis anti-sigma factor FlgM [Motiliproteus sp.]